MAATRRWIISYQNNIAYDFIINTGYQVIETIGGFAMAS
jgi:hypothetical protein